MRVYSQIGKISQGKFALDVAVKTLDIYKEYDVPFSVYIDLLPKNTKIIIEGMLYSVVFFWIHLLDFNFMFHLPF